MEVHIAKTDLDYESAKELICEYQKWLNVDLCFQKFDAELNSLATMYGSPNGAMILIKNENEFIGCVGLRRIDSESCEMKRMFVKPSFQGNGAGWLLLNKLIEVAQGFKYKKIKLDTFKRLEAAIRLYKKVGFYEISPYCCNPDPEVKYFEYSL